MFKGKKMFLMVLLIICSLGLYGCGGGGGGGSQVANGNPPSQGGNGGNGGNNGGNGGNNGGNGGNNGPTNNPQAQAKLAQLIGTNNDFSLSVCPSVVLPDNVGNTADVLLCEKAALQNIKLSKLTNPQAVAKLARNLLYSTALNVTGLFNGNGQLAQAMCPQAKNILSCVETTVQDDPPAALNDALNLLGCSNASDLKGCLTGVGQRLSSGALLTGVSSTATGALCPNASSASKFDGEACLVEAVNGVGSIVDLTNVVGLKQICGSQADPVSCLLQTGGLIGPVINGVKNTPVVGNVVDALLGAVKGNPANLNLLKSVGPLVAGVPVVNDLLANAVNNGGASQVLDLLGKLQGLPAIVKQVPVLGDLLNGLAGGNTSLPLNKLNLQALTQALTSGNISQLSQPLQDVLNKIPTLGPLLGQVLGSLNCQSSDPLTCLTSASNSLGKLSNLINQVPVLGNLLNPVLSNALGGSSGSALLGNLQSNLQQIPQAGALVNKLLGGLLGGASGIDPSKPGNLLVPVLGLLNNNPVLGDLTDNVVTGLLSGKTLQGQAGIQSLVGNVLDSTGGLLSTVGNLLNADNALAAPLVKVLHSVTGSDNGLLKTVLSPISGVLKSIPGLGGILGGLLGLLGL